MDSSASNEADRELLDKLVKNVKRTVKQIMEESVTRKFVHEDSSSVTALCAAVDSCLANGLKRRALGLFKTNSTTALLQKVAKNCDSAAMVLKKVTEIENSDPNKRSSSSSDSLTRTRMSFKIKSANSTSVNNSGTSCPATPGAKVVVRYLWIRVALLTKQLANIVDHVVQNSCKYYEKDALVSDPVAGQILASLLVGPCFLDYTKMKTNDQFWSDPPADELVQRHRISSSMVSSNSTAVPGAAGICSTSTPPTARKPLGMSYRRPISIANQVNGEDSDQATSSSSPNSVRHTAVCWSPRDYVESLHQNSRSTLLYGKNNVIIQPKDDLEPMPGYLSLHAEPYGLIIKWTPNQLINGRPSQNSAESSDSIFSHSSVDKSSGGSAFWNHALNVSVESIVYLHCHQQKHSCGSIVMVGRDGVMHPPIKFPKGGHLLSFLSCLETGLQPYGQLDPPLWSQKGKGKVFPKLRRKGQSPSPQCSEGEDCVEECEDVASDYVFRVISMLDKPETISPEMMNPKAVTFADEHEKDVSNSRALANGTLATLGSSDSTTTEPLTNGSQNGHLSSSSLMDEKQHIQILCDTMKKQIISRAFLRMARLLSPPEDGITAARWTEIRNPSGQIIIEPAEFYRLVYYGGVEPTIRAQVWPYLLEHYRFGDTEEMKGSHDREMRQYYEMVMSEWLAVEAIVRQRDKEMLAANLAKLSSESNNSTSEMPFSLEKTLEKTMLSKEVKSQSNEVFEDNDDFSMTDSRKSSVQSEKEPASVGAEAAGENQGEQSTSNNNKAAHAHVGPLRKQLMRHRQVESVASLSGQTSSGGSLQNILITNPSIDQNPNNSSSTSGNSSELQQELLQRQLECLSGLQVDEDASHLPVDNGSSCVSPASSNGGIYSAETLDQFSINLHRIDKDVQRCDRNFWYFTTENLEKLRNVMCTYVWKNMEMGYVQGMCDLVAPLLVIFNDEVFTYSCFCELMKRMKHNFPLGGAMDTHFANMRSLVQILDVDIFELMQRKGDYTHFYFCYRWFLLDFKRELVYADVFSVWETIWAAKHVSSASFVLFIALALVEYYREIIIDNKMDFTDIIKFFNEMAERHDAKAVLQIARDLVLQVQTQIENK
ncbi:Small G protein signaling modulator 2 [Tyrophagus putrescentiae]|nr:Small G protein signaling modulator 2 [Tyrophagus putrescentiae]